MSAMLELVIDCLRQVMHENGVEADTLEASTNILSDSGIDSLGLALTLVLLEEKTGKDPFKDGFIHFRTVGELAKLYE